MRQELEDALLPAVRLLAAEGDASAGPLHVRGVLDAASGRVFVHPFVDPRDADSPRDWRELEGGDWKPAREPRCALTASGFCREYAPDCFTQVNPELNELLIAHAVESLAPAANQRVLEAFAGIGNFTLPLAARAREVVAVERRRSAEFGERNARAAGFANARFIAGDAALALPELARRNERFELLLVDPPREGLGEIVCAAVGALRPARLVYVSCEPRTLADDLQRLGAYGYCLRDARAFDMFPQTFHVETVATLEL
jgi:23S rRNA (uracil1939-C5)-methyltransferase